MQPLSDIIASTVRAELARNKLRAVDLAPALDVDVRAAQRRVAGEIAFELDELPAVAAFLGISIADLAPAEFRSSSEGRAA